MAKKKKKKQKSTLSLPVSKKTSRLQRLEKNVVSIFTIFSRLLILALAFSACFLIYKSLSNDDYIIQSFQVPKTFEEGGNSGLVISKKVQDKIKSVKKYIDSSKADDLQFQADDKPNLEVDVIGFGLSLNSLTYHLKSLLGRKNYIITGELTDVDQQMELTMRMTGYESKTFTRSYESDKAIVIDELMEESAKYIIKNTDPYRVAIYHYRKKEYPEALRIITNMIVEDRDVDWAYMAWGNLLTKQGNKEEALQKHQKALAINPNFSIVYENIGWIHFNEENYDLAIEAFEKRLKDEPNDFDCMNGIALSHRWSERHEETIEAFDLLIRSAPDILWGYANKADYLLSRKDTSGATALFSLAKSRAKDGPDKYLAIGGHYMFLNQLDSAAIYAKKILEIEPENAFVLNNLVRCYYYSNKIEKALEILPEVRNINEEARGNERYQKQSALNLLAMSNYRLKKYDEALILVQEAIDLNPDVAFPYTTLAETYGFMGRVDDFYAALETALEKGFLLKNLLEDEPYIRFINQPRFQKIIQIYQEKEKEKELAQAVKG